MKRYFFIAVLLFITIMESSCENDKQIKLNKHYSFLHEGYSNNQIVGEVGIFANVIACYYNSNFILAK